MTVLNQLSLQVVKTTLHHTYGSNELTWHAGHDDSCRNGRTPNEIRNVVCKESVHAVEVCKAALELKEWLAECQCHAEVKSQARSDLHKSTECYTTIVHSKNVLLLEFEQSGIRPKL